MTWNILDNILILSFCSVETLIIRVHILPSRLKIRGPKSILLKFQVLDKAMREKRVWDPIMRRPHIVVQLDDNIIKVCILII